MFWLCHVEVWTSPRGKVGTYPRGEVTHILEVSNSVMAMSSVLGLGVGGNLKCLSEEEYDILLILGALVIFYLRQPERK